MAKTAVVIGATGLVGFEVVKQLVDASHVNKVVTLTRRPLRQSEKIESSKLTNHVVDFDNLANEPALFKADMLFSCLGTTLKEAGSIESQRRVDLDYQYQAAKLASQQGTAQLLLVSSSGANVKSLSPYMKMKGELEDKVATLNFQSVSIFQPSLLLGNRSSARLAEDVASKIMPLICKLPGLSRYRPISGAQVATKMVAVSERPSVGIHKYTLSEVFPG